MPLRARRSVLLSGPTMKKIEFYRFLEDIIRRQSCSKQRDAERRGQLEVHDVELCRLLDDVDQAETALLNRVRKLINE